jgi:transposase-like protein
MPHIFDHTPTAQEVFDEACSYFATSPGPSIVPNRQLGGNKYDCAYRATDGRVCVAGHFLPDESYLPQMDDPELHPDGSDVKSLVKHYGYRIPAWFRDHRSLLKELQTIHDNEWNWAGNTWNISHLVKNLKDLAVELNLSADAVEQVVKHEFNWDAVPA